MILQEGLGGAIRKGNGSSTWIVYLDYFLLFVGMAESYPLCLIESVASAGLEPGPVFWCAQQKKLPRVGDIGGTEGPFQWINVMSYFMLML